MSPRFPRHLSGSLAGLLCVVVPAALPAQAHPITLSVGAGFVAQRQTGPDREMAIGYTAVVGVNRPLTSHFRLHADARYSFDLVLGPTATRTCWGPCAFDGLSATKVLSTVVGLDVLTSRNRIGLLARAGTGLHLVAYPSPGRSGLYPALATAVGLRVPITHRRAFTVEARYDRLFGVTAGPNELIPLLLGFEL